MAESQRLYERIAQKLSSSIARGEYKIGQRLPSERELAQAFDDYQAGRLGVIPAKRVPHASDSEQPPTAS